MLGVTPSTARVLHLSHGPFPLRPCTLCVPVGTLGVRPSPTWVIFGPLIFGLFLLGWIIDSPGNGPLMILGSYWSLDDFQGWA